MDQVWTEWIDMSIVGFMFVFLYIILRKTEAIRMLFFIFIIFLCYEITLSINLLKTALLFRQLLEIMTIGIVVLFHPEFKIAFKKIGGVTKNTVKENKNIIDVLEKTAFSLASKKIGALIVLDNQKKIANHTENKIELRAVCTQELLETIFTNTTPLHDGAVIMEENIITYASCKLPLSGKKRSENTGFGTRHLVAIETAEKHDVKVIVVSEETGRVSIATNKGITLIENREMFRKLLKK